VKTEKVSSFFLFLSCILPCHHTGKRNKEHDIYVVGHPGRMEHIFAL